MLLEDIFGTKLSSLQQIGSGNETISHLYENERITIMFTACEGGSLRPRPRADGYFSLLVEGPPRIVRLFGKGERTRDIIIGKG